MRINKTQHDFADYTKLIHALAWSIHRSTRVDQDDLFGEGALAFVRVDREFDKTRHLKFSTLLTISARNAMLDYAYSIKARPLGDAVPLDKAHDEPSATRFIRVKQMIASLGAEAREVVEIILGAPSDVLGVICSTADGDSRASKYARSKWHGKRSITDALKRHLKSEGWEAKTINGAFDEIRDALREV